MLVTSELSKSCIQIYTFLQKCAVMQLVNRHDNPRGNPRMTLTCVLISGPLALMLFFLWPISAPHTTSERRWWRIVVEMSLVICPITALISWLIAFMRAGFSWWKALILTVLALILWWMVILGVSRLRSKDERRAKPAQTPRCEPTVKAGSLSKPPPRNSGGLKRRLREPRKPHKPWKRRQK